MPSESRARRSAGGGLAGRGRRFVRGTETGPRDSHPEEGREASKWVTFPRNLRLF